MAPNKLTKSEKKAQKKLSHCIKIIEKNENLNVVPLPTKYLLVGNGGLMCGFSHEKLMEIFQSYGPIERIQMLQGKSYSFVIFQSEEGSQEAVKALHGQPCPHVDTPLFLAFVDSVPEEKEDIFNISPPGLTLVKDVISQKEEETIIKMLDSDSFTCTVPEEGGVSVDRNLKHRRVQHFGFEFEYGSNSINPNKPLVNQPIPDGLISLLCCLQRDGFIPSNQLPNQLTVNHYLPGQGIPPHVDSHSACEEPIISISLASQVVMDFRHLSSGHQTSIVVPPRSMLIMAGESRLAWSHGITPRKSDIIPIEDGSKKYLTLYKRQTRISLTFRYVRKSPCNCAYPQYCDSQNKKQETSNGPLLLENEDAEKLERDHVQKVYDTIASHFSETRHTPWPQVSKFLQSLPSFSLVLDVGCGNGKYLGINSNLIMMGCDNSIGLLSICRQRGFQVFAADTRALPYRSNSMDACISIAVLHHLSTEARRCHALEEMIRILKPGGLALVYVWAMEQDGPDGTPSKYLKETMALEKDATEVTSSSLPTQSDFKLSVHTNRTRFKNQDVFVPWKSKDGQTIHQRFYHVFVQGELEKLSRQMSQPVHIVKSFYDTGNWCIILEKKKDLN